MPVSYIPGLPRLELQYIRAPFVDSELAGYTTRGWYFWDETQSQCAGPFQTKKEAYLRLQSYISKLLSY